MAQQATGRVVAGDYKGKFIVPYGLINPKPMLKLKVMAFKKENMIEISSETVKSYEVKNSGTTRQKIGVGLAVVGAGKIGAEKEGVQIAIMWKDGKKSLIECNGAMENLITASCF